MQFEFITAGRIIFGPGKLNSIANVLSQLGKKVLILSGCPKEISNQLLHLLETQGIGYTVLIIRHEPTVDSICDLVEIIKGNPPEVIIGMGGGSTIDSAKASAALAANPGEVIDYLEVIGHNQPLLNPSIPVIAIPTTSGTGAEVTRNAVIGEPDQHVKVSLRSPYLLPKIALVDPELTLTVPLTITAYTGLDALTQLIEPFTCNTPNPMVDALCLDGIKRVGRSLYTAYDDGDNLQAREEMALASLFGGLSLANAKLGAVHGFAGPLGGEIDAPHGAICASLLPHVMEANLDALMKQSPDHPVIERYATIGRLLCGDSTATATLGIQWVRNFCQHAQIPSLSSLGLTEVMFAATLEKAEKASSMKGNPVILSEHELRNILQNAL